MIRHVLSSLVCVLLIVWSASITWRFDYSNGSTYLLSVESGWVDLTWSPTSRLENDAICTITSASVRNQWCLPRLRLQMRATTFDKIYDFHIPFWLIVTLCFIALGGIWWADWRVVRLQHRRKHGLCLFCGYNLCGAASERCSECGHPINPARKIIKSNHAFFALLLSYIVPAVFFLLVWIIGQMPVLGGPWTLTRRFEIWQVQMMGIAAFVLLVPLGRLGIITAAFGCGVVWGSWFLFVSYVPLFRRMRWTFHFALGVLWFFSGLYPAGCAYLP